MKSVRWTLIVSIIFTAFYLTVFLSLVFWPFSGEFNENRNELGQWQAEQEAIGSNFTQDASYREDLFIMRDGETLYARRYGENKEAVIIFIHGVAGDSAELNHAAGLLHSATNLEVITPELRGHGQSGGEPYQADYIGQYEDDLEDIVLALKKQQDDRQIYIGGHSMGGGVAMRYALKENAPVPAGYVLFAPNFGDLVRHPAPESGTEADRAGEAFVRVNVKRLIGLVFLGIVGMDGFDALPVVYFNRPPNYPVYSYSAIASAQPNPPEDASVALAAVETPLIILVGADDEVFDAGKYEPLARANPETKTIVFPGLNHNSVLNSPMAHERVGEWLEIL